MAGAVWRPDRRKVAAVDEQELRRIHSELAAEFFNLAINRKRDMGERLDASKEARMHIEALLRLDKHVGKTMLDEYQRMLDALKEETRKLHGARPERITVPSTDDGAEEVH